MRSVEVLALIPARGGSKSIPRKNIQLLAGKPLIAHSIDHALAARTVTRTIVSTDDDEIAEIAKAAGAEVPFRRPAELSGDESTDMDVFRHALEWLAGEDFVPDLVVHLRPTYPIRAPGLIDEAVGMLIADPAADSLRSVSPPHQTPYKMWRMDGPYLVPLLVAEGLPDAHGRPRQSLPQVWSSNGCVDVVRARTVLELGSMAGDRILSLVMTGRGVDIDDEEDLLRAEALLAQRDAGL